ncbi:NAD-binding protein [Fomitiporia mediterranea MF3/22]|uniref:NAD-binding protein n=1 Tax=Fomitiporia mediterranea (strain MF3/22) TaxID=694068 RepID=UPI000440795B|nr:NAD-binding protein [Fomitiporia mediterranea MF3/22]EJC99856.1 NAD-binding protein [Fomitiporia mediterranea MF3/22]
MYGQGLSSIIHPPASVFFWGRSSVVQQISYRRFSRTSLAQDKKVASPSFGPVGVEAALRASSDPSFKPKPTLLEKEFSLAGHVAVVTGAQRGLGLEAAEALAEAGATVYCLDLPAEPDKKFIVTQDYVSKLGLARNARLEYASVDVTDQKAVWKVFGDIAEKEGRLDACVAAAGLLRAEKCLDYPAEDFQKVMDVNVNGVMFTAQAAGRQMVKFGRPGSIILIASMTGSVSIKGQNWLAYETSKSAVTQMGRSMACELGPEEIRVNTLSPGFIYTALTAAFLDAHPGLKEEWSSFNPLGRIGRPDELRGVIAWLASDASSFCTGSDILVSGGHHSW